MRGLRRFEIYAAGSCFTDVTINVEGHGYSKGLRFNDDIYAGDNAFVHKPPQSINFPGAGLNVHATHDRMIDKLGFSFSPSFSFLFGLQFGVVVFITSLGGLYTLRWHFGVLLHSVLE